MDAQVDTEALLDDFEHTSSTTRPRTGGILADTAALSSQVRMWKEAIEMGAQVHWHLQWAGDDAAEAALRKRAKREREIEGSRAIVAIGSTHATGSRPLKEVASEPSKLAAATQDGISSSLQLVKVFVEAGCKAVEVEADVQGIKVYFRGFTAKPCIAYLLAVGTGKAMKSCPWDHQPGHEGGGSTCHLSGPKWLQDRKQFVPACYHVALGWAELGAETAALTVSSGEPSAEAEADGEAWVMGKARECLNKLADITADFLAAPPMLWQYVDVLASFVDTVDAGPGDWGEDGAAVYLRAAHCRGLELDEASLIYKIEAAMDACPFSPAEQWHEARRDMLQHHRERLEHDQRLIKPMTHGDMLFDLVLQATHAFKLQHYRLHHEDSFSWPIVAEAIDNAISFCAAARCEADLPCVQLLREAKAMGQQLVLEGANNWEGANSLLNQALSDSGCRAASVTHDCA